MKATPLIINWHDDSNPIYAAHFQPAGKGRLATGGGDGNVRLWKVDHEGEDGRKVEYLATLAKHTQTVNVVRWAPKGDLLASAGDDGNVILWVPDEGGQRSAAFGTEDLGDKESWRAKAMARPSGAEIFDLAWSPDGQYFIIGSMDNVARIFSTANCSVLRQVADHSHYVQGVAWDPLNEYIATQSSDRSVHIYSLKTKDGQYTLAGPEGLPNKVASHIRAELPSRRISSNSPAPPSEFGLNTNNGTNNNGTNNNNNNSNSSNSNNNNNNNNNSSSNSNSNNNNNNNNKSQSQQLSVEGATVAVGSPVPSAPGTPTSLATAMPMNPPSVVSHSRRSSISSRRSLSPAPSLPLPAVMPMEASPKPHASLHGPKSSNLYHGETLASFFRRLTFTPEGSLLLTPSGQYQTQHLADTRDKTTYEVTNTVYIYSRGGINKAPIAHLPGHKKPSIAVRCSPVIYALHTGPPPKTKHITIDTSSAEDPFSALPEPLSKPSPSVMEPPPPPPPPAHASVTSASDPITTPKAAGSETPNSSSGPPTSMISLTYRIIYAVATQDSVLLYDTQQKSPFCVVSNLHCATFTDLTWSSDGLTLLISSSDGFCSALSFVPGELGQVYTGELGIKSGTVGSSLNTPVPTSFAPPSPFSNGHQHRPSSGSLTAPSPPSMLLHAAAAAVRPSSPARSNSNSSISSAAPASVINNPPLIGGSIPSITAANSGMAGGVPATPPETPRSAGNAVAAGGAAASTTPLPGSAAAVIPGGTAAATAPTPGNAADPKSPAPGNAVAVASPVPAPASAAPCIAGNKRDASETEGEDEEQKDAKKRRIQSTPVDG